MFETQVCQTNVGCVNLLQTWSFGPPEGSAPEGRVCAVRAHVAHTTGALQGVYEHPQGRGNELG